MMLLLIPAAFAHSSGQTGSSTTGCTSCHATSTDPDVTSTLSLSATTVAPSDSVTVTSSERMRKRPSMVTKSAADSVAPAS